MSVSTMRSPNAGAFRANESATGVATPPCDVHCMDDAQSLLDWLDPQAREFCFRAIHPTNGSAQKIAGAFSAVVPELTRLNSAGYGIFVVINAGGHAARDITRVRAVFADFDGIPLPESFPLRPHVVVQTSPGKWHVYWGVADLDLSAFKDQQKAIAWLFGSDASVCDLPRVMRLPGFLHTKGTPFLTRVMRSDFDLPRYDAEQVRTAFLGDNPRELVERKAPRLVKGSPDEGRALGEGDGCHADVVRMTARMARIAREEGVPRASVEALLAAEAERGRWGRDMKEEAKRGLDSALAKIDGGTWRTTPSAEPPSWLGTMPLPEPPSPTTDLANGLRLYAEHGHDVIHVPGMGFYVWSDSGWTTDDAVVQRMAQRVGELVARDAFHASRQAASAEGSEERIRFHGLAESLHKWARNSGMSRGIDAALGQFRPLITVLPQRLDADPWLLGCANGTIDLRTGELLPLAQEHLLTLRSSVTFDAEATCGTWLATLEKVLPDPAAQAFFQRFAGYLLTGTTNEQVFLVAYGSGANGKSTLFNAMAEILGDYAKSAPPGLLLKRHTQPHPTELAYLKGRRLIVVAESPEGACFDEERVKALTGSDPITARGMRQDFFTFEPTHKFALMTNYRPAIRGGDNGIWRRVLLLPFEVTVPASEQDPMLPTTLRSEYPGILAWLVRGCLEYRQRGLDPPVCVRAAVEEYREDSDPADRFFKEECAQGAGLCVTAGELYAAYSTWSEHAGELALPKNRFGELVRARGFIPRRTKASRVWEGIALVW